MDQQFKDYYERLGVPRTASDQEIKRAYFRLARQHHPDLHSEKEKDLHTKRMQEVNEAYAVLSSKENRAKYDQFGEHWKEGPPPVPPRQESGGSSAPSDDAFSDFFQNMFSQEGNRGATEPDFPSELDIEATLDLSLEEAVRGVEKTFSLMTTGLCQNCHGTGRKGKTFCPICGGVGEIRRQREVKTKIPPGLTSGGRIRLKGQGYEGSHVRGDLYLNIRLLPHPDFKIDGKNLETTLVIRPWQAVLGSSANVLSLDGPVSIRIPEGSHTGTRLRLSGKGLGKPTERGDLFIRIVIDIPNSVSPKAKELYKQIQEESSRG